jgi:hypothetical protein
MEKQSTDNYFKVSTRTTAAIPYDLLSQAVGEGIKDLPAAIRALIALAKRHLEEESPQSGMSDDRRFVSWVFAFRTKDPDSLEAARRAAKQVATIVRQHVGDPTSSDARAVSLSIWRPCAGATDPIIGAILDRRRAA